MEHFIIEKTKSIQSTGVSIRSLLAMICCIAFNCACFAGNGIDMDKILESDNLNSSESVESETTPEQGESMPSNTLLIVQPAFNSGIMQVPRRNIGIEMYNRYPTLYYQYRSGRSMKTAGAILTGVGIGISSIGLLLMRFGDGYDRNEYLNEGAEMLGVGVAFLGAGIPLIVIGGNKQKSALREFETRYYASQPPSHQIQLKVYGSSVGLAYTF